MLSFKPLFNRGGRLRRPSAKLRAANRAHRGYVPGFEILEDRITPNTYTVTDNADSTTDPGCLRYLINHAASGDTILFQTGGLSGGNTIDLKASEGGSGSSLSIVVNLTVQGPTDYTLIIEGGSSSGVSTNTQVFSISSGLTVA